MFWCFFLFSLLAYKIRYSVMDTINELNKKRERNEHLFQSSSGTPHFRTAISFIPRSLIHGLSQHFFPADILVKLYFLFQSNIYFFNFSDQTSFSLETSPLFLITDSPEAFLGWGGGVERRATPNNFRLPIPKHLPGMTRQR